MGDGALSVGRLHRRLLTSGDNYERKRESKERICIIMIDEQGESTGERIGAERHTGVREGRGVPFDGRRYGA